MHTRMHACRWAALVLTVAVLGDEWTGATRSPAYDFDAQFWCAPLHCLWLYHAARLKSGGGGAPSSASSYTKLEAEDEERGDGKDGRASPSTPRSLATAFLSSPPMMHLGDLSYGIYIYQLGAMQTVAWYRNLGGDEEASFNSPAVWLNTTSSATWGYFVLEPWHLLEVLVLLVGVAQLVEYGLARLAKLTWASPAWPRLTSLVGLST